MYAPKIEVSWFNGGCGYPRKNGTMGEQEAIGLHQLRPLAMAVDPE
jgi:hypothetical protein